MLNEHEHSGSLTRRVNVGRVDSLTLYEITDYELDQLEQGSPSSLQLNFACALLPLGIGFIVTLSTTEVNGKTYTVFVMVAVLSLIVGLFLLASWWTSRKSNSSIVSKIKERVPTESSVRQSIRPNTSQSNLEGNSATSPTNSPLT